MPKNDGLDQRYANPLRPYTGQTEVTDPLARALLKQAMENQPMYSPWHLAGRLAQFGAGTALEREAQKEDAAAWDTAVAGATTPYGKSASDAGTFQDADPPIGVDGNAPENRGQRIDPQALTAALLRNPRTAPLGRQQLLTQLSTDAARQYQDERDTRKFEQTRDLTELRVDASRETAEGRLDLQRQAEERRRAEAERRGTNADARLDLQRGAEDRRRDQGDRRLDTSERKAFVGEVQTWFKNAYPDFTPEGRAEVARRLAADREYQDAFASGDRKIAGERFRQAYLDVSADKKFLSPTGPRGATTALMSNARFLSEQLKIPIQDAIRMAQSTKEQSDEAFYSSIYGRAVQNPATSHEADKIAREAVMARRKFTTQGAPPTARPASPAPTAPPAQPGTPPAQPGAPAAPKAAAPPAGWRDTGRKTSDGRPIFTDGTREIAPRAQ